MNKVVLVGRLTKDIDMRYSQEGGAVGRFSLAVDRFGKDNGADFINCIAFGKRAEIMSKYTGKGTKIAISGRIQTGSYEKDGRKVYTTDVVVDDFDFCESKQKNDSDEFVPVDETKLPFA